MNGKTHAAVGMTLAVTVAATNWPVLYLGEMQVYPMLGLVFAAVGGLAADIDKKETTMGQRHPWLSKLFKTHRGITHTPLVCLFLLALIQLFQGETFVLQVIGSLLFGFVVGYWSHVFIDVFNGKGIPHLWPLIWKRMHMMSVVTGTVEEKLYMVVFMFLCAFHVVCTYAGLTI